MADPEVKNVNLLSELTDVAAGDALIVNDVSEIDNLSEMTKQIRMDKIKLFLAAQIADGIVTMGKIADGAVNSNKLYNGVVVYNQHLYDGCVGSSKLAGNSVIAGKIALNAVDSGQIVAGAIDLAHLASETVNEINKNLVYMQLFQPDESIITTTGKTQFFVPAYLAGKQVRQIGIGIVTPETGRTVTVQLGTSGAYGSIAGAASKEETVTKTLPGALTKIPVNVSVTTGTPAPKGLDLWFLVY